MSVSTSPEFVVPLYRHTNSFLLHSKFSDQPSVPISLEKGATLMEKVQGGIQTGIEKVKETVKPLTEMLKPEHEQKLHEKVDIAKEKLTDFAEQGKQKLQKAPKPVTVEWEEVILAAPTQGVIKEIYCSKGEYVQRSDKLCLIENPTTRIIVCSDHSGKIKDFMIQSGEVLKQNQALFSIEVEIKHPGGLRENDMKKKNLEKKRNFKKIDPLDIYKRQFLKAYYRERNMRDSILQYKEYIDPNAIYDGFDKLFKDAKF